MNEDFIRIDLIAIMILLLTNFIPINYVLHVISADQNNLFISENSRPTDEEIDTFIIDQAQEYKSPISKSDCAILEAKVNKWIASHATRPTGGCSQQVAPTSIRSKIEEFAFYHANGKYLLDMDADEHLEARSHN